MCYLISAIAGHDWASSGNVSSYLDSGSYQMASECRICADERGYLIYSCLIKYHRNTQVKCSIFLHLACLVLNRIDFKSHCDTLQLIVDLVSPKAAEL